MIDFTNRKTLISIKVALIRSLNSLDNEIGAIKQAFVNEPTYEKQFGAKLKLLEKSRDNQTALYNQMDAAIDNVS